MAKKQKYSADTLIFDLSKVPAETREQILATPKFLKWFSQKPKTMLQVDTSAKTIKGNKLGFKTAILYLSSARRSGTNVCANAHLAGCIDPCLIGSGRGAMACVEMSRLRKTLYWLQYQAEAIAQIKREIAMLEKRAAKQGWILLVRLNGTSDIRWENSGIIQAFPAVQFYDYTKLCNRKNVPANYDLTFSYSGVALYAAQVQIALANKLRIAVVFAKRSTVVNMLANSETFLGLPVVDGDDTDIRHLDPMNCVVALYAKGKAKHDRSGFVVH
jgi:hypothetical protein